MTINTMIYTPSQIPNTAAYTATQTNLGANATSVVDTAIQSREL